MNENCAEEGHVRHASYEEGIRKLERCPWTLVAIVIGFVGAVVLSMAAPMGFAP